MEALLDILLDSFLDCVKALPFLLITIFLLEYIEHRAADRFVETIRGSGRCGPALGALLGCVPQCGFSAACAELFNGGFASAGTLVAVFLSTSDEAIPVLLANPDGWKEVAKLLFIKLFIGMAAGFLLDAVWSLKKQREGFEQNMTPHICKSDDKLGNIFKATFKRTLEIFLYLFLFTLLIAVAIHFIG